MQAFYIGSGLRNLEIRSVFICNLYQFLSIWHFWFTDGSFDL